MCRGKREFDMRSLRSGVLIAVVCAAVVASATMVWTRAPAPSRFNDTESVTNIVFDAGIETDRIFGVQLDLVACSSNCVEVAFGWDSDQDGELSREEADWLVGWDAGAWVVRDRRAGIERRSMRSDGLRRLELKVLLNAHKEARRIEALDEDGVVFEGSVPTTFFDAQWNLMRIMTRGLPDSEGVVVSRMEGKGFGIIIR